MGRTRSVCRPIHVEFGLQCHQWLEWMASFSVFFLVLSFVNSMKTLCFRVGPVSCQFVNTCHMSYILIFFFWSYITFVIRLGPTLIGQLSCRDSWRPADRQNEIFIELVDVGAVGMTPKIYVGRPYCVLFLSNIGLYIWCIPVSLKRMLQAFSKAGDFVFRLFLWTTV